MKKLPVALLIIGNAIYISVLIAVSFYLFADSAEQPNSLSDQRVRINQNQYYQDWPQPRNISVSIGDINISIINATEDDSTEIIKDELKNFPIYNLKGLNKIVFAETPLDRSGKPYAMYYYPNGTILIRPGLALERNNYAEAFSHEVGHHIMAVHMLNTSDFEKFKTLHNKSDPNNFISPYATESVFEDIPESISHYRGDTRLFYRISGKNEVMRQKFLLVAKQFCRDNNCTVYKSAGKFRDDWEEEEFSPYEYSGNIVNRKGFFNSDEVRFNVAVKNISDFSEFETAMDDKDV